ncbi:5-hydroxytryptamine receptor-like isoform X3 [Phlebotomus papatasi]|uniref:5-hydroxytryptamine receptor-like isoform X3 n=2 Tax=Phlebotomus papatasi TaxID=29031 RepID=UPI0024844E94|nr:5-hydroxytryptamine receptor-like isoform X3 [Phlebotomus papatasi]
MNEFLPSWWPWSRPDDSPQNESPPSSNDDTDQAPIWRLGLYNGLTGLLTNISTSISGVAEHSSATKTPAYLTSSQAASSVGSLFDATTSDPNSLNLTVQSIEWTYANCTRYLHCDPVNSFVNDSAVSAIEVNSVGITYNRTDFFSLNSETLITMIVTAIILGIVILATVIGNVFVIAAILLERNLQSVANYLILSLAVADLLVACLVMPLSAVYEVSQEWRLGAELCDMWTSSDVLCCTASILHLVAIALDRYWAVTDIDYAHQRTARRIGVMILVVWTLSFLVSVAPLLGWKDPEWGNRLNVEYKCMVSQDVGYQIFATASSFYLPLLVILVLYWRIFQTARKRIRRRQQVSGAQAQPCGMIATAAGGSAGVAAAVVTVIGRPLPTISETTTAFTNVSSTNTSPEKTCNNGVEKEKNQVEPESTTVDLSVAYPTTSAATSVRTTITRRKHHNSTDSKRERKAAKTLAIITGAFVCCWLPFFILAVLIPVCASCDISPIVMSIFLWLGYFNSTLNPIIYTIFSPEFRQAFKRLLCRRKSHRLRTRHMGLRRGARRERYIGLHVQKKNYNRVLA